MIRDILYFDTVATDRYVANAGDCLIFLVVFDRDESVGEDQIIYLSH